MILTSPSALSVLALVLLTAGYVFYRALFPKLLPGIPYVKASATRPLGDLPEALAWEAKTRQLSSFLAQKCYDLQSPIVQVSIEPFKKPWIVLCESREAQDIMARRTREFDRSDFFINMFKATVSNNQVCQKTNEKWRSNRRLMADTMSPQFLQGVAAPTAHRSFSVLMEMWTAKAELAQGHPFDAKEDVEEAMMESIFTISFGGTTGTLDGQLKLISSLPKLDELASDNDAPAVFPKAPMTPEYHAMSSLAASSEIPVKSPLGTHHHAFALRFSPNLRKANKFRHSEIKEKLETAWQKFKRADATEDDVKSAADLIVEREVTLARKQGREPSYDNPTIRDELFGFLVAGFDTTATTVMWGLNFLQKHQEVQTKLRDSLKKTFAQAVEERRLPSAAEIAKTKTHYLDSVIEETLRCGNTAAVILRTATEDTEILGYHVPKGTDVFMLTIGPSSTSAPFPVEESKRSKSSQFLTGDNRWTGDWDSSTLGEFVPERWLRPNEKGEMEFDHQAGPMQIFGGGLRGCFGKKLAYLSMRILFTLIIWNFELGVVPSELATFEASDEMTHRPQQTYVRLQKLSL